MQQSQMQQQQQQQLKQQNEFGAYIKQKVVAQQLLKSPTSLQHQQPGFYNHSYLLQSQQPLSATSSGHATPALVENGNFDSLLYDSNSIFSSLLAAQQQQQQQQHQLANNLLLSNYLGANGNSKTMSNSASFLMNDLSSIQHLSAHQQQLQHQQTHHNHPNMPIVDSIINTTLKSMMDNYDDHLDENVSSLNNNQNNENTTIQL
jgi:hypothetical protein